MKISKDWFESLAYLASECEEIDLTEKLSPQDQTKLSKLIGYASSAGTFVSLDEGGKGGFVYD